MTGRKVESPPCLKALEENVFVAAGVEPINVDVGIDV
jgi:hypothetical protein